MQCPSCGNPVEGVFCSRCGAPVQAAPPPAYPPVAYPMPIIPRVQQHLQTLGIMWCVFGVYRAAAGLFGAMFLFGMSRPGFLGNFGNPGFPFGDHMPWMAGLAGFVAIISLVFAALSFLVGFSLMNRKPWGRTLAIVISIFELIKIPFGTALGIYTLWVLAPAASRAEYEAIAEHA
jgi:hypothetical protein